MARRKKQEQGTETGPLLEKLALVIANECLSGDDKMPFDQKLDAFKVLKDYYATITKLGPNKPTGVFNGEQVQGIERGINGAGIGVEAGAEPEF